MTKAGFTYKGTDLGNAPTNLLLVDKRIPLIPSPRDRVAVAGPRPGVWDFGTELGERRIELDVVTGDNANWAGTDAAIRELAKQFDPTTEAVAGDKAYGQLILDSEPDRYWLAKLIDGPFPQYLPSAGKLKLTLRCQDPFAYSTAQYVVQGGSGILSGFTAYRQTPAIPDVGAVHGWNLVKNGGFIAPVGSEWTLHANASRVVDATSPTGFALRLIATASGQESYQDFSVEAGQVYSMAGQMHADGGANPAYNKMRWLDASGATISEFDSTLGATGVPYAEVTNVNRTAPGNARTLRLVLRSDAAGIFFFSCIRLHQQATAPAAWSAADQQTLGNKGLAIYEAATNLSADGDMEAAGVGSWTANNATLTKDTTNPFAGTRRLKVVTTAANGSADQTGALAAAQAITASVRCIGGDAAAGIKLISTPSNAVIGTSLGASTDYVVRTVSGTIAGGDTGWKVQLIGGGNGVTSYFDNLWVANQAYDTGNADASGQAFALAARTASSHTETLESDFNIADFGRTVAVRFDHGVSRVAGGPDRYLWIYHIDANNRLRVDVEQATGRIRFLKVRAGVSSIVDDAGATAFAAGDSVVVGVRHSAAIGLEMTIYKNGVLVGTYTSATPEAKLTISGTPTTFLGANSATGNELDGAIGIDRHLKAGVTAAQVTTSCTSPYAQQDEAYESVVYRFDGSATVENYASGVLQVDVGGTYWTWPVVEITAGGAYTGNVTVTDASGNVFTWNGTLALNDVLKIDTEKLRAYLNSAVSMSGVANGSKWPVLLPNQRNALTVGGIAAGNIKALKTTFRARWI